MNLDFTVMNYKLDNDQLEIVKDDNKYLFVLAGAGSGKTLTILGKIKYLIEEKHIPKEEIVCITFTNMAVEIDELTKKCLFSEKVIFNAINEVIELLSPLNAKITFLADRWICNLKLMKFIHDKSH